MNTIQSCLNRVRRSRSVDYKCDVKSSPPIDLPLDLLTSQLELSKEENLLKTKIQQAANWSWEMFGTLVLMVETFGGVTDKFQFCLKKLPKNSEAKNQSDCQEEKSQYVLVLDLDETLVHANIKRQSPDDFHVELQLGKNKEEYYVRKRPYLSYFLEKMAQCFELVIFTASIREYADKVIDYIDPKGYIKRRFYRDSCTVSQGSYYKDLSKIESDLEKVCIIDNSTSGLFINQENGMLIKSWYCDSKDKELRQYANFLQETTILKQECKGDIKRFINRLKRKYPTHIIN